MIRRFGVSIEDTLLERFDALIDSKGYANRSEAVRDLIRKALVDEEWSEPGSAVVGALTLVYDHHTSELTHKLLHIQHDAHDAIVSTMHIHLDGHNCLEVIVLRGTARQVEDIANRLISARGVKHGRLFRATRGEGL